MRADEIRYKEDMPSPGLNLIRPGLDDVLYDPKTKPINTNDTKADYYTKNRCCIDPCSFFRNYIC